MTSFNPNAFDMNMTCIEVIAVSKGLNAALVRYPNGRELVRSLGSLTSMAPAAVFQERDAQAVDAWLVANRR